MKKFPLKPAALWRHIYPTLLVCAIIGQGVDWLRGDQFSMPSMLPLMVTSVCYVLFMHVFSPTLAGTSGLRLINIWGLRRAVAWDEIVDVRNQRRFHWIPSLRVRCANGRVYWIDTEAANLAELYALAAQSGGPQHPLALALATPLYAL